MPIKTGKTILQTKTRIGGIFQVKTGVSKRCTAAYSKYIISLRPGLPFYRADKDEDENRRQIREEHRSVQVMPCGSEITIYVINRGL